MTVTVLRRQLTARRPSTRPPGHRPDRAPRVLTEEEREQRAQRCPTCGGRVLLPCYSCWLDRHIARGGRFDPNDQYGTIGRPAGIPAGWSCERVQDVWLDVLAGVDPATIGARYRMQPSMVSRSTRVVLEYVEQHP